MTRYVWLAQQFDLNTGHVTIIGVYGNADDAEHACNLEAVAYSGGTSPRDQWATCRADTRRSVTVRYRTYLIQRLELNGEPEIIY